MFKKFILNLNLHRNTLHYCLNSHIFYHSNGVVYTQCQSKHNITMFKSTENRQQ